MYCTVLHWTGCHLYCFCVCCVYCSAKKHPKTEGWNKSGSYTIELLFSIFAAAHAVATLIPLGPSTLSRASETQNTTRALPPSVTRPPPRGHASLHNLTRSPRTRVLRAPFLNVSVLSKLILERKLNCHSQYRLQQMPPARRRLPPF